MPNKGFKHSEKTREKMRLSQLGMKRPPRTEEWKRKQRIANLGRIKTPEARKKMSESKKGKHHTEEHRRKIGEAHCGMKRTEVTRKRMSKAQNGKIHLDRRGEKHWNWRGGITPLRDQIRFSLDYKQWKGFCLIRDDFTCQDCKIRGGNLHAHHLKEFALIIKKNNIKTLDDALACEELWDISNGITLCKKCHEKRHNHP